MQLLKRLVCVILVFSMVAAVPAIAAENNADEDEMFSAKSSSYFGRSSVYLHQASSTSTTFEVWFDVSALSIMDELGASKIKIQRSSDGANWTTMWTYTKESYPGMICANTALHAYGISYTGTVGYYYRALVYLYAKKGTGFAEMYEYTSTLKL